MQADRTAASKIIPGPPAGAFTGDRAAFLEDLRQVPFDIHRTCPVQTFGRARTYLGRAAGRDRFPPDVTCPLPRGQGRFPRRPSPGALFAFRHEAKIIYKG